MIHNKARKAVLAWLTTVQLAPDECDGTDDADCAQPPRKRARLSHPDPDEATSFPCFPSPATPISPGLAMVPPSKRGRSDEQDYDRTDGYHDDTVNEDGDFVTPKPNRTLARLDSRSRQHAEQELQAVGLLGFGRVAEVIVSEEANADDGTSQDRVHAPEVLSKPG